MAARRVIIVRDVDALKKDCRTILDRYLARPARDSMLVLTTSISAREDKGLASAAVAVRFDPLGVNELPRWVGDQAAALGVRITKGGVSLLIDLTGNDLWQLRSELEKLVSYGPGDTITEENVSAVVGVRRTDSLAALLDAVALRDARQALEVLPSVLEQPKISAVTIVMALATQTLAIAWGAARHLSPGQLAREFYTLLKAGGAAYTARPWGEAVPAWTKSTPRWSAADADRALRALAHADLALRESKMSSDQQTLATLILDICGVVAAHAAA